MTIYIDGVQRASGTDNTTGTWETTGQYAMLAKYEDELFNGLLDELRVSSVVRSGTWIQTEYNNQFSPPGFYVLGAEMTATTVNSTGDAVDLVAGDGRCDTGALNSQGAPECTLRAAIEEVNALAGADTIRFNIPTTEPGYSAAPLSYTIQPGSALPLITEQLDILGNTQPDFPGTPIIVVDGISAGMVGGGRGVDLAPGSDSSTIRGLVLINFRRVGMRLDSPNNTIAGNWIGLAADGVTAAGNGNPAAHPGLIVEFGSDNNIIGGTVAADRNVVSGSSAAGIVVGGANNLIIGNYVGTDSSGAVAGVGNAEFGIGFQGGGESNTVGGTSVASRNLIADNGAGGIRHNSTGTENRFLGNSIHSNGGLGIDLDNDGVTLNDAGDGDAGPNDLLNFPELNWAGVTGANVTVDFDLDVPLGDYRIEFFTNPSGTDPTNHGEGEVFAGSVDINHPGGGSQTFSHTFPGAVGDAITATTTTCTDGTCTAFVRTSEFSEFETAVAGVVTVDDVTVVEGVGLLFTVTLNNTIGTPFTVDATFADVTATGGAAPLIAPEDYDNALQTLNFAGNAGETQTFTVPTLDDAVLESIAETFTVNLSSSNPNVGDTDTGTGTILDNDATSPSACNVFVDQDAYLKASSPGENHGTDVELSLQTDSGGNDLRPVYRYDLSGIPVGSAVVSARAWYFVTSEDSNGGVADIHRITDAWTEGGVNWGNTATDFDPTVEGSFTPSVSSVWASADLTPLVQSWVNGTVSNDGAMLIVNQTDTESKYTSREWGTASERPCMEVVWSPTTLVSIAATDTPATEPGGGVDDGQFTVTHSSASATDTVISYVVLAASTATAGSDYTALSGTVTIPALATTATIDVAVLDDAFVEASETVVVQLTGITSGDPLIMVDSANDTDTVTIDDDDSGRRDGG